MQKAHSSIPLLHNFVQHLYPLHKGSQYKDDRHICRELELTIPD